MELLVLREGVHRLSAESYAEALRERLDDHRVRFAATPESERRLLTSADVVTGPRIREDVIQNAEELRLFACTYAGYGHLPMESLEAADIAVTNATGVHAPNVAEHVLGAILTFSRRFHDAARAETWQSLTPGELAGSTVTIVGLGAIGTAVADRFEPFDVRTLGIRRTPSVGGPTDEVLGTDHLHEALAQTEYLVLCCPLTEATRGLIGSAELSTLSPEAVIVNVARGAVIDTDSLVSSLRRGRIGGAALDVTDPEPLPDDHPLWNFDEVLITPHSAGSTPKYYDRLADIVSDNVRRLADGEPLRNRVRAAESD